MKTRQELGQWGLITPSCSLFSKKIMGVFKCVDMHAYVGVCVGHANKPLWCLPSPLCARLIRPLTMPHRGQGLCRQVAGLLIYWLHLHCTNALHCMKIQADSFLCIHPVVQIHNHEKILDWHIYQLTFRTQMNTHAHTLKSLSLCMVTSTKMILNKKKVHRWFPYSSSNILFFFSRQDTLPDTAF